MTIDLQAAAFGVTQTLYRYCRGIDRMDEAMTLDCFEPSALLEYSGLYRGDPAGFVEWLWPVHAAMVGHTHSVSNVVVDVDDGVVVSEAYVMVTLRINDGGDLVDLVGRGRYLDRWTDGGDRWRIARRTYVTDLRTVQPVVTRDVSRWLPPGTPGQAPIPGGRDRDDPSYAHFDGPAGDMVASR